MTRYEPHDPTAIWRLEGYLEVTEWRQAAIRACRQSLESGLPGVEAWLTAVEQSVQQRTSQRLEKVASGWRRRAAERCRPACEAGNWETAATELVYYIEEVVRIYRRQLQRN